MFLALLDILACVLWFLLDTVVIILSSMMLVSKLNMDDKWIYGSGIVALESAIRLTLPYHLFVGILVMSLLPFVSW